MIRTLTTALVALSLCAPTTHAAPPAWTVDHGQSAIAFGGSHAGRPFAGKFERWTADIRFSPDDLANSAVSVTVDLTSAATGDATYDKTLPTADWFDIASAANATFTANAFTDKGNGGYEAQGTLSLRGVDVPVTLAFTLVIDGDAALMAGNANLQRMAFGIGKSSDAPGDWVSLDIPITVTVIAKRQN